jgi:hypothetical protein
VLVALLADYPPARDLGFTEKELHDLLVLRGRVSHAATKGGIRELAGARAAVILKLDRLKCLVERVLTTKRSWGSPTHGVDELSPLGGYFDSDGGAVIRAGRGRLRGMDTGIAR